MEKSYRAIVTILSNKIITKQWRFCVWLMKKFIFKEKVYNSLVFIAKCVYASLIDIQYFENKDIKFEKKER